ncbi:TPA: LamG domain-containing protein [Candidatus Poribacteria bacterium]|nr:LamG domain-containing protein [Candidatus Poribacteria bacterium]HIC01302.1 LamG domain-containing protein [Candidatus Poribacteria bacterium]HIN75899.1 LamG domain-containing protein [Rhodospirillales bacterium]HIP10500.1 LamG domain-containing protein [Rhodospirillales bacterium]
MNKPVIRFIIQKLTVFSLLLCGSLLALEVLAADEPTAIWLFDKKDNNVVKDLSGNGHDGEIHGTVDWTKDGQFGGALAFAGKDGWIEVEDHKDFHFPKGTDFTLACWVKITGDHAQPPMLIAKSYGQQGQKQPWYALYYANQGKQSDGDISFFCRDAGGTSFHIAAGQKINDDKWHHVVGTRDNGTMYLYLDGKEKSKKAGADFDVGTHDGHLHMMTHANRFMNAVLDEALIYKGKALSTAEIKQLMKDGTEALLSVSAEGKATTTWGRIKLIYR